MIHENTVSEPTRRGRPRNEALHGHILWTAAQLFGRQGVAQTTTREVAAEAGTTERTLFKHFTSKEGLVQAVMDEAVLAQLVPLSLVGMRTAIARYGDDLQAWHCALLTERLRVLMETPDLVRLLVVEVLRNEAARSRFSVPWRDAVWEPLLALFRQLQSEGRLRSDVEAATLVRQFLSLNLGLLVGRVVLAPAIAWDDGREIAAVAAVFAAGASPAGGVSAPAVRSPLPHPAASMSPPPGAV